MHIAHCNISQYNETLKIRVNPLIRSEKDTFHRTLGFRSEKEYPIPNP